MGRTSSRKGDASAVKWWGWGLESKTYRLDDKPQFWPYLLKTLKLAQLGDGLFDIVSLGDLGFLEAVSNLGKFRKGTHLEVPKVSFWRGRTVVASSEETQLVEMEGEVVGRLPARFEMPPKAMKLIV